MAYLAPVSAGILRPTVAGSEMSGCRYSPLGRVAQMVSTQMEPGMRVFDEEGVFVGVVRDLSLRCFLLAPAAGSGVFWVSNDVAARVVRSNIELSCRRDQLAAQV